MINKNKFIKKQMTMCLNCKIGTTVISNYEALSEITNSLELDKEDKNLINEISDSLELPWDFEENYRLLKQLFSDSKFDEETTEPCLVNLQRIVKALENSYSEDDENVVELHPYQKHILNTMHERNKKTFGLAYKNEDDITKALNSLYHMHKHEEESDDKEDEDDFETTKRKAEEEKAKLHSIANGIKKMINAYSKDHRQDFDINNNGECFRKMFLSEIDMNSSEKKTDFSNRLGKLPKTSELIMKEYLTIAPKKFGYNLQIVMQEQNITEQDLKHLTGIPVSAIQSLEKADVPKKDKTNIQLLCRALLVSEDVLYKGIGKIYGNWKDLFKNDSLEFIAQSVNTTGKNDTKKYIRKEICNLINMDTKDFRKLVQENPDLFCEEDFHTCTNWAECYDNLLHQEEALTLLEVLEKMQV